MKLIVEAGSTKTDSILINKNGKVSEIVQSKGINPVSDPSYVSAIEQLCSPYKRHENLHIHYYGSGCINPSVNTRLAEEISKCFESTCTIEIQDDLLAVGRGLCQNEEGIVGILGTGSNIGVYDGNSIVKGVASCGYLLGDEGSGFRIGQEIYTRLARQQLTKDLQHLIYKERKLTQTEVIPKLYAQINPRQYLASFAVYIQKIEKKEQKEILDEVFDSFIKKMIQPVLKDGTLPVYLSGSIAFHFRQELREKLRKFNNIASYFMQSPLEGLIKYHHHGKGN